MSFSVTKKYTLLTFKWHSGPAGFSPGAWTPSTRYPEHVKTNTGNRFKQLEEVTTIICLRRSHFNIQLSVNGRDHFLFSPSPTVFHTILQSPHEKAIYKQWRLTICTGLIKHIFSIKEKDINRFFFFPSIMYKEQKKEVLENDWAPQSHCVNSHREKLLPSTGFKISSHSRCHFPIRYMQKRTGASGGSAFIQRRPKATF